MILQQGSRDGWWVLTDRHHGIVLQWQQGKFNETQKATMLHDEPSPNPLALARQMREMGDWLAENHPELI